METSAIETETPRTPAEPRRSVRGASGWAAPLALLLLPIVLLAVSGPLLRGEALVPGGILYAEIPPWKGPLPPGVEPVRYPLGDVVTQFHPWTTLVREAYRDGRLPLWNPYSNCGSPLLANGQSAAFFPTRLLDVACGPALANLLGAWLRLAAAGLAAYALARRLGQSRGAAAFSGAAFELSGFLVAWLAHPHANVALFLPLLFLLADRVVSRPCGRTAALLALAVGVQFLGGHPETSFHALLATAAFALFRLSGAWRDDRSPGLAARRAAFLAAGAAAGAALAAAALLPLLEYLGESSALFARTAKSAAGREASPALALRSALALAFPRALGIDTGGLAEAGLARFNNFNERAGGYAGLATLAAAVAGVLFGKPRGAVLFLAGTILACVPLVYDCGALTRSVGALPLFSIAANRRFLLVVALALALLGGFGLDAILRDDGRRRRGAVAILAFLALAAAGALVVGLGPPPPGEPDPDRTTFAAAQAVGLALVGAAAVSRLAARSPRIAAALAFAGLAVDLVAFAAPVHRGVAEEFLFPDTPLLARLRERTADGSRVSGESLVLRPETGVVPRLRSIKGYDAVEIRRYTEIMASLSSDRRRAAAFVKNVAALDRLDSPVLDLLAVRFVLTPAPLDPVPPGFRLDAVEEGVHVYENAEALPRAFVVERARSIPDAAARRAALASGFDPRSEVILESDADAAAAGVVRDPAAIGRPARLLRDEPERVDVEADGGRSGGILVLADAFFPGWTATVDGRPARILRANHALRAVAIGPGPRRVEFRFEPASLRAGLLSGAIALAAILVLALFGPRRQ